MTKLQWIRNTDPMSADYRLLTLHVFRAQAIIIIQRFIRKHQKSSSPKTTQRYTTHNKKTLAIISEPVDETYLEHVKYIQENDYLNLNFSKPNFVKNLYKALRLGAITLNQLSLAKALFDAQIWLGDSAKKPAPMQRHEQECKHSDAQEDAWYYTVQVPKHFGWWFFYYGIHNESDQQNDNFFINAMGAYVRTHTPKQFDPFVKLVYQLIIKAKQARENLITFWQSIKTSCAPHQNELAAKDDDSVSFAVSLFNSESSLDLFALVDGHLSLCIFSQNALAQDLKTKYHTTTVHPLPVLGSTDPRLILTLSKQEYDQRDQALYRPMLEKTVENIHYRCVEFTHPDIMPEGGRSKSEGEGVHSFYPHDSLRAIHDYRHCDHNSAWFKEITYWLRSILLNKGECDKPYMMSAAIWALTDLNQQNSFLIRNIIQGQYDEDTQTNKAIVLAAFFLQLINLFLLRTDFEASAPRYNDYQSDVFLLLMINMIKQKKKYQEIFNDAGIKAPLNQIIAHNPLPKTPIKLQHHINAKLQSRSLNTLIKHHPSSGNESLILRYKLHAISFANDLIDQLELLGLRHFMYWSANSGLYFFKAFRPFLKKYLNLKSVRLNDLDETTLACALVICIKHELSYSDYGLLVNAVTTRDFMLKVKKAGLDEFYNDIEAASAFAMHSATLR